jgi:hypothetical protein
MYHAFVCVCCACIRMHIMLLCLCICMQVSGICTCLCLDADGVHLHPFFLRPFRVHQSMPRISLKGFNDKRIRCSFASSAAECGGI